MKRLAFLLVTLGCAFVLGGCNTMEGIGKDIKKSGEAIEKTADQAKK